MQDILIPLISVAILIFSASFHEVVHGLVALYFGDTTAQRLGRLSLNPIVHMELFGSLVLPALLVLSHSPFVFGWAKPVPVNPRNIKKPYGYALVALAGPVSNLCIAIVAGQVFRFTIGMVPLSLSQFLITIVIINCTLALFNMIPLPPLDGYHVLEYVLQIPQRISAQLAKYSFVSILIAVIFFQKALQSLVLSAVTLLTGAS